MSRLPSVHSRLHVLNPQQQGRELSPWTLSCRIKVALWHIVWLTLFRPTPKPLTPWRLFLLKLFGCKIEGKPFVASSAIIKMPWQLSIGDRAAIAPGAEIYNLAPIHIGRRATVAQQVYLCAGTHDLNDPMLPLVVGEIDIGEEVFIGVRALILPGVIVGDGAVIGGGAVVAKHVEPWTIVAGNPGKFIRKREFKKS